MLFQGEEAGLTFHPQHLYPSDFPCGTHGKGSMEECYLLELSIFWMPVSQIPVKVLMGRDLSRKSLGNLPFRKGSSLPSSPRGFWVTRMKGEIGLIPQHHLPIHPQHLPSPSHCFGASLPGAVSGSGRRSPRLSGNPGCAPGDFHAQQSSHSWPPQQVGEKPG